MVKRSSKRPRDANQLGKAVADLATDDTPPLAEGESQKNPHAVALGRLGGLKGGKARASILTKKQRSAIAKKTAAARWAKKPR